MRRIVWREVTLQINPNLGINVAEGATLVIKSNDFYAENLTIDNEWWTKYEGNEARGPQALSLYVEADRVASIIAMHPVLIRIPT